MASIKTKDLRRMSREDRERKLEELRMELIKSKVNASKTGSSQIREIKRLIARIITLNKK